jgi:hypothetical protein
MPGKAVYIKHKVVEPTQVGGKLAHYEQFWSLVGGYTQVHILLTVVQSVFSRFAIYAAIQIVLCSYQ